MSSARTLVAAAALAAVLVVGCVRTVTVCTQYDRRLGTDASGWQRDGASTSVCAEIVPPGAAP